MTEAQPPRQHCPEGTDMCISEAEGEGSWATPYRPLRVGEGLPRMVARKHGRLL